MQAYKLTYRPFGPQTILIEWPPKIDPLILDDVLRFKKIIENNSIKLNVEVINTYSTITVFYIDSIDNIYDEISSLEQLYTTYEALHNDQRNHWKIPVCYDREFALDLDEISQAKKCSRSEIISLHSSTPYTIYFIGFLPGFLYLGGLSSSLFYPRKDSPRTLIPSGAVGIGGHQTGIYPQQSAGGWNLIGNSPISFFDRKNDPPCLMKPGDLVSFVAIDKHEHSEISKLVAYKRYQLESEVIDA